jgi:hypothetical protein
MSLLSYLWPDARLEHVSKTAAAGYIKLGPAVTPHIASAGSDEFKQWLASASPDPVPERFAGELLSAPALEFRDGVVEWALETQTLKLVQWLHATRPGLFYKRDLHEGAYEVPQSDVYGLALEHRRLDVLKWWIPLAYDHFDGHNLYSSLQWYVVEVAGEFSLKALRWLLDEGLRFTLDDLGSALSHGNMAAAELMWQTLKDGPRLPVYSLLSRNTDADTVRALEWAHAYGILATENLFVQAASLGQKVVEWAYENRESLGLKPGVHGDAFIRARTPARRNWLYERKAFVGTHVRVPSCTTAAVKEWLRAREDLSLEYDFE